MVMAEQAGEGGVDAGRPLLLVLTFAGPVAIPSEGIVEVLTASPIASLPGAPDEVAGLVNRRGGMLTVIDLGEVLRCGPAAADPEHRVVVVEFDGREVGVAVNDVLRLTTESAELEGVRPDPGAAGRRRPLHVVELEPLLGRIFRPVDETGKSSVRDHEWNRTDL